MTSAAELSIIAAVEFKLSKTEKMSSLRIVSLLMRGAIAVVATSPTVATKMLKFESAPHSSYKYE